MANHAADDITYYLVMERRHENDLAAIRHWENLKVAFDEDRIWIRDFDFAQIHSVEVKSIPYKELFYGKQEKLFPLNSQLPCGKISSSLLWTPILRALPVRIPTLNHNYFGTEERLSVQLVPSAIEREPVAMVLSLRELASYVETAPAIRLQPLSWTVVNRSSALIAGTPFLPVNGPVFWRRGVHLLPAGYDLELFHAEEVIARLADPDGDSWIFWNPDNTCIVIPKDAFTPLSVSSFRSTIILNGSV
jgi:hypothetical protein